MNVSQKFYFESDMVRDVHFNDAVRQLVIVAKSKDHVEVAITPTRALLPDSLTT